MFAEKLLGRIEVIFVITYKQICDDVLEHLFHRLVVVGLQVRVFVILSETEKSFSYHGLICDFFHSIKIFAKITKSLQILQELNLFLIFLLTDEVVRNGFYFQIKCLYVGLFLEK